MASQTPIMPFLRPLRLPQSSTVRQFLSFSTTSKCTATAQQQRQEDRNLTASRTAPATYPPPSMKSLPRPKESRASRRTSHPPKSRPYPTRYNTLAPPPPQRLIPEPVTPLPEQQSAPNLPYFVTRSRNNELPVYTDRKRGGNLKQTLVSKIDGDATELRDALRGLLGLGGSDCVVNPVTGKVVLKGHWKGEVVQFLRERRF